MAHAALYAFTAFYIGRMHELFTFLAALRIVLILGLLTIGLAISLPADQRHRLWLQPEVRIVAALCALAVLFFPFSAWPGGSWDFLADTYSRVIVFFSLVVALATSVRIIRNLFWSVLAGVGILGIFTIQGAAVIDIAGGRFYASSTYDPNDVAMMMVCALPLAAFGAIARRGPERLLAIGTVVICVLAIVKTVSRGGFIGLVFVSLLLLFRLGTAGLLRRLMVLATAATILLAATPGEYWDVMRTIWNPRGGEEYLESGVFGRTELWKQGLDLFFRSPVTGVGIGTYVVAEGMSHGGFGKWSAAHNSFIQLATELGVVGFALFVTLLIVSIRNARRAQRAAEMRAGLRDLGWIASAIETSLYAYMVVGLGLSQAYSPMLYFLVGVAAALRAHVERHQQIAHATAGVSIPRLRMASS